LQWAATTTSQEAEGVNEARGFPYRTLGAEAETEQHGNACCIILR
jgi:hypothetical protein